MDDEPEPPEAFSGARLTFGSPLSAERAARLTGALAAYKPSTILDLGCGWGSLLLAIAAAVPSARATGVDKDADDVARARTAAEAAGLADRVQFIEGEATSHLNAADLVLNVGAWHALGTMPQALSALRDVVNPGGHLLFAAEYWERTPTEAELRNMWAGMTADDCCPIAGLVDRAIAAGFRPLRIESVTRGEWEEFESSHAADREEWLLTHPDHPKAEEVRTQLDQSRNIWLRGHRDILGFAYLTLGVTRLSVEVPAPGQVAAARCWFRCGTGRRAMRASGGLRQLDGERDVTGLGDRTDSQPEDEERSSTRWSARSSARRARISARVSRMSMTSSPSKCAISLPLTQ